MHSLLDLLFESKHPEVYFLVVFAIIGSIVLHELGHAFAATWEGDPTPRMLGHLTWKPWVHMSWIAIALVAFLGIGFGATPVNRRYFRHRRFGEVLVSAAGPLVNLFLAAVAAVVLVAMERAGVLDAQPVLLVFWETVLYLNAALFVFNLIPLPPLDGFGVIEGLVDLGEIGRFLRQAQPFTIIAAIALVNIDDSPVRAAIVSIVGGLVRGAAALLGR